MGTHSTVAVPSHGSRDVTWCRAELLLSHGTSGLLLATEGATRHIMEGAIAGSEMWRLGKTRLLSGKGQNQSLGKALAGREQKSPGAVGDTLRGCSICSPVQLG